MTISLDQADRIIEAVLRAASGNGPVTVVVTDAGGSPKAFKKQDGGYLLDFEIALGRAFASLALSPATSEQLAAFRERNPGFRVLVESIVLASKGRMAVEAGGARIVNADKVVVGAVGVAGLTPDECQKMAVEGLKSAGV